MKCNKCNYENPSGINFCVECGTKLLLTSESNVPNKPIPPRPDISIDGGVIQNYFDYYKWLYWCALILGVAVSICWPTNFFGSIPTYSRTTEEIIVPILIIGSLLYITSGVFGLMIQCKAWELIGSTTTRTTIIGNKTVNTTPKKAIRYQFIPVFNLFWIFVAFIGLSQNINHYIDKFEINAPKVNHEFSVIYSIFSFLLIPFLGFIGLILGSGLIAIIAFPFLSFFYILQIKNSVISIINN